MNHSRFIIGLHIEGPHFPHVTIFNVIVQGVDAEINQLESPISSSQLHLIGDLLTASLSEPSTISTSKRIFIKHFLSDTPVGSCTLSVLRALSAAWRQAR